MGLLKSCPQGYEWFPRFGCSTEVTNVRGFGSSRDNRDDLLGFSLPDFTFDGRGAKAHMQVFPWMSAGNASYW